MDEAMKKLLAELGTSVKALNDTVSAKFSNAAPAAAEAEKDALVKKIQDMQDSISALQKQKTIRKMVWAMQGQKMEDGMKAVTFGEFLKAVNKKDDAFMNDMGIIKTANGQSEGTNADGGYSVPTEYANEIIKLETMNSIARQICRLFPMGSLTRQIPRQLTQPTVTWTNEATNHTKTKVTLEPVTQTAKKLSALIPFTEELLSDNNVNLDSFIFQVVAEAIGREEDRVAFAGNSDPFTGVKNASGVNSASMAGATLAWQDLVSQMMTINAAYRKGASWVIGTTELSLVMKMADDQNRPIWAAPIDGAPGRLLGMPYFETDQVSGVTLFGNFANNLWISDRGGYEVKASDSASDANGSAGSAFLQDEIWYKFRRRMNIVVANPAAFVKMTVA